MIRTDKEVELLLACSRPQMDSVGADRICRLLQEEIDWDWMLKAARSHGVWPIMYHNLKAVCPEAVPQDIFSNLKNVYLNNAMWNLMLSRELLRIIEDFQEHGVDAVPFKGPTLAQAAYGDIMLRQFSDLDIMVRRQDVLTAKDLLISRGYRPQIKLTPFQERLLLQGACEYNFVRNDPVIPIEVHWMFHSSGYSVPFDEGIWSRLEMMTFEGTKIYCFPPEDLVLALCAHGTRHRWAQMKLVSDIAGLIERSQIDWEQVNMIASDTGLKRILHIGLLLAHDLLGVMFSEQISGEIERDVIAKRLALKLSGRLFSKADSQEGIFKEYLFWARTRERLRDKAKYLALLGTEPTLGDMDAVPLPESLFFLYRIIRPFRLFYQYGLKGG